jgi:predicted DNA-binding transcriptional regulator AlpA
MDQVLSLNEFAKRAGITRRSVERMIADGTGPAIVRLMPRRVGILEKDAQAWLLSRRQPVAGEAQPARRRGRPCKAEAVPAQAGA